MRVKANFMVLTVSAAIIAAAVLADRVLRPEPSIQSLPVSDPASKTIALPTPPDRSEVVVSVTDHKLERVRHKDIKGRVPFETVYTDDGPVTIQRTFGPSGMVLKEEAFLNGTAVPVPKK